MPIVFPVLADPVGAGFVDSLARPGGNITGFMHSNTACGKWLELLKEIAPGADAGGILRIREPSVARPYRRGSPCVGLELSPINVRDAGEIERAVRGLRARRRMAA